jgi:hypothetical protein
MSVSFSQHWNFSAHSSPSKIKRTRNTINKIDGRILFNFLGENSLCDLILIRPITINSEGYTEATDARITIPNTKSTWSPKTSLRKPSISIQ